MKATLSLTLILALVIASVSLAAQDLVGAGPLARAMTREAVRLAAEPGGAAQQAAASTNADWCHGV